MWRVIYGRGVFCDVGVRCGGWGWVKGVWERGDGLREER